MDQEQFKGFIEAIIRKNKHLLKTYSTEEIRTECWAAVMEGMNRWDGSMGKLNPWVYTTVIGRIKDLKKKRQKNQIKNAVLAAHAEYFENICRSGLNK